MIDRFESGWRIMKGLDQYRQEIDKIDEQILKLLNKRARVVLNIAKVKREGKVCFHAPLREKEIFSRLSRLNPGPFPKEALRAIFREIISSSLALEAPVRVSYLGPEATFSHQACLKQFGSAAQLVPMGSLREVFEEVERGRADYGVVPIENSTEGVVSHTLDLFVDSPAKITGEIIQNISHFLLSKNGKRQKIKKLYSHPQAIAQCGSWLEANLKGVEVVEVASTGKAAALSQKDPKAAAIASELAAPLYGLRVVEPHIEDQANNVTRFLVISMTDLGKTEDDKTSILFSVKDRVGALYHMLQPFSQHHINLSKIESRPSKKKPWEYIFYVDLEGHQEDQTVKNALKELEKECLFLKVLGSYPKGQVTGP
jgi:chorismate mutase/prephenate dehydratase